MATKIRHQNVDAQHREQVYTNASLVMISEHAKWLEL